MVIQRREFTCKRLDQMAFRKMAFRSLLVYTAIQLIGGQRLTHSPLSREQRKITFTTVRMANEDQETFFTQAPSHFPEPTLDEKIKATDFLAASDHLAKFFGLIGNVFSPVQSDISGNVKKVGKFIEENPGKVVYINDIILLEAGSLQSEAISSLLWLKRTLEFTMQFLDGMVSDTKSGSVKEDLSPLCLQAYEETLKKHHGWLVQQVFYLVSKSCPWRRDLLASLALGKPDMESIVLAQMEEVLVNLKRNVFILNKLL